MNKKEIAKSKLAAQGAADLVTLDPIKQGNLDAIRFDVATIKASDSDSFQHRLWYVESQLVQLTFEVAFLYSVKGEELARVKGTARRVQLSNKHKELVRGGILTHNHPDGSFFSPADIELAHECDLAELRAVSLRDPLQVFILRRPEGGWRSREEFSELIHQAEIEMLGRHDTLKNSTLPAPLLALAERELVDWVNRTIWPMEFPAILTKHGYKHLTLPLQEPEQ
jgi:hypothetical protein